MKVLVETRSRMGMMEDAAAYRQVVAAETEGGSLMNDLWMLLFTLVFFGLAFGYVRGCEKLG